MESLEKNIAHLRNNFLKRRPTAPPAGEHGQEGIFVRNILIYQILSGIVDIVNVTEKIFR